jgi:hypothetical protein
VGKSGEKTWHIVTTRFNPTAQTLNADEINSFEINKRILYKQVIFPEQDHHHYWSIFLEYDLINPNKNKTKAEMKVLTHDDLTNDYVNHRIHRKFQNTLKQHEEEIRVSLNFV